MDVMFTWGSNMFCMENYLYKTLLRSTPKGKHGERKTAPPSRNKLVYVIGGLSVLGGEDFFISFLGIPSFYYREPLFVAWHFRSAKHSFVFS